MVNVIIVVLAFNIFQQKMVNYYSNALIVSVQLKVYNEIIIKN